MHRMAISNHRIRSIKDSQVTFTYKDRQDENNVKPKCLDAVEFIRRLLLYVLPGGFMKIRYFGFMARRNRKRCIELIRSLIDPGFKAPKKVKETVAQLMKSDSLELISPVALSAAVLNFTRSHCLYRPQPATPHYCVALNRNPGSKITVELPIHLKQERYIVKEPLPVNRRLF